MEEWYKNGFFIDIEGYQVFYRRTGKGPALLCIHGFPTSSWDYHVIWKKLAGHFDVIAFDLIGLGRSSKPLTPITVSMQADIAEKLTEKLGITSSHILAHDLGDTVAQELIVRQLDQKSNITWQTCVLLNGGLFTETHRPRFIQKLLMSPFGSWVSSFISERTFRKNMKHIFSQKHPPTEDFLRGSWKLIIENNGKKMMPRLIKYMSERQEKRERWVGALQNTEIPLLLINGARDPISGQHMADRYRELISVPNIVSIKDAGHYPHLETPAMVTKAILKFHGK